MEVVFVLLLNVFSLFSVRVALEPAHTKDVDKLVQGLHLLNQADANVQVLLTDKGEHILVTAGEVHLERCLKDLKETYAGIELNASAPIVPFRETVIIPPKTDMVNETLNDENKIVSADKDCGFGKSVTIQTADKRYSLQIRAFPLPVSVTELLDQSQDLLKILDRSAASLAEETLQRKAELKLRLEEMFKTPELESLGLDGSVVDRIWSFGPRKSGPNLLINGIKGYARKSVWTGEPIPADGNSTKKKIAEFDSACIGGFQLASLSGPVCEEPMMGVGFILEDLADSDGASEASSSGLYGPLAGQIMSSVKEGCRRAFQTHPQRLMAAMYSCEIQVKAEVLGKLFASLGKRNGKVVKEEMIEGSSTFTVTAHIPVIESLQFAQEIRRQTSGKVA